MNIGEVELRNLNFVIVGVGLEDWVNVIEFVFG